MTATAHETEKTVAPPRTAGRDLMVALRRNHLAGLLSIAIGLALWEVLSRYVVANPLFLAAPSQIVGAIFSLGETGELWRHIGISGLEFIIGYAIASVLGIALGLAMASSVLAKQVSQPWISGLYATPTIALAPLFILWFGIGISSKRSEEHTSELQSPYVIS